MSFFSPSLKAHNPPFEQDPFDKKPNYLSYSADDMFANMREDFAKLFHENNLDLFTNAADLGLPNVSKPAPKSPKAAFNHQSGFLEGAYTTLPPLPTKNETATQRNTIPSLGYSPLRFAQGESNYGNYMTEPNGGSFNNKNSFSPNLATFTPSRNIPKFQEDPYAQFDFFDNYNMKDFPDPDDFVDTYADESLNLMWSNDAAKALKNALSQPVQSGQSPEPEPHHYKSMPIERNDIRGNNYGYNDNNYKTEYVDHSRYGQNYNTVPVKREYESQPRPQMVAPTYNERMPMPDLSKNILAKRTREQPKQNDFVIAQKKPQQQQSKTWDDDDDDKDDGKGRSSRGLRVLSLKVRDIVQEKKKTTYKEVAESLMGEAEGPYKTKAAETKEEQNVKRRVYDALNVLIAAGVIKKEGKLVSCTDDAPVSGGFNNKKEVKGKSAQLQQRIAELRRVKAAKLDNLQELLYKTLAVKNLVRRNKEKALTDYMQGVTNNSVNATRIGVHDQNAAFQNSNGEIIKFPFLVVVSSNPNNSMNINMDVSQKQLAIESRFALNIFGDIDVLLKMRLHNVSRSFFEQTVPQGLEKFLPKAFLDNLH